MQVKNREEVILLGSAPNSMRTQGYTLQEMIESFNAKSDNLIGDLDFELWYKDTYQSIYFDRETKN